jgi:hypothetical protein
MPNLGHPRVEVCYLFYAFVTPAHLPHRLSPSDLCFQHRGHLVLADLETAI